MSSISGPRGAGFVPGLARGSAIASSVAFALLAAGPLQAQSSSVSSEDGQVSGARSDEAEIDEVVVTGVFIGIAKEKATTAISTVDAEQIENLVPQSAADLITNVPGVFVSSAHGEIRNVIYSRGVSANSLDGATGYYYVAMEEDGLPVTNVTWINFGPDYFLRSDLMVDRLEAVRGGAAAITGPNAPGGLFNYLSRRGGPEHTGRFSVRSGLEGDGRHPYYRGDLWLGGPLGGDWTYSIGGFFRRSDGSQHPRFPMNEGGQVKFNLTRDFSDGYLQFYGKYLNDRNGFTNFIPAVDFSDPRPAPAWSITSNPTPPRTVFDYQIGPDEFAHFDSSRQQDNTSKAVGMRLEKKLGETWTLKNDAKYSDNSVIWNSWVGIQPESLTDIFTSVFYGTLGILGTYTYQDPSGTRVAHVEQTGVLTATLVDSNLPLNDLMPGGVIANLSLDLRPQLREVMDQISLTKELGDMSFTLGAFYAKSDASLENRSMGFGVSTLEPNPQRLDLSILTPDGQTLQVTNDAGIGPPIGRTWQSADWEQLAAFFGHRWEITPDWTFDWGVRWEQVDVEARNPVVGSTGLVVSTTGGVDGDPNTLYDNRYASGPTEFLQFGRKLHNTSYTAALYHAFSDQHSAYARYAKGAKAPDLAVFFAQNDPAALDFANTSSQKIEQVEIGYRYTGAQTSLVVTPYYSLLDNVQTTQRFVDRLTGIAYPRVSTNALEAYGVELEGDWQLPAGFGLRAAVTWQRAEATKRFNWVQGPTREEDVLVDLSGGKADNNPDVMATITPSYRNGRFYAQAQWRHMGKRPANANNAFYLPAFDTLNLMARWRFNSNLSVTATVNNALNSRGVMGFTVPATNLVAALDRQSLTAEQIQANPDALFTILPIQPRAYYLEMSYDF